MGRLACLRRALLIAFATVVAFLAEGFSGSIARS
jgi:hypothetical protein